MRIVKSIQNIFNSTLCYILEKYNVYRCSIRYKITALVTLTLLVPISLSGIYLYYFVYNNVLTQNINKELNQSIQQINNNLVSKFRITDNTFNLFLSNQVIRSNLEQLLLQKPTYYLKARTQLEIDSQLKYSIVHDYAWNSKLLKSVFVFKDEVDYYYLLHNYLPDDDIINDHMKFFKYFENIEIDSTIIAPSSSYKTIYFMKDIKNIITHHSVGRLVFGIDENILMETYNNIIQNPSWKAFIFDNSKGTIFFHNDRSLIGKKIDEKLLQITDSSSVKEVYSDNEVYLAASQKISDIDMTSIIMIPKKEITSKLQNIIRYYLYIIILAILLALIVSVFVVTSITRPIKDLINKIEDVNTGNFDTKMPLYKYSELNQVSVTFNKMIDKIHYLFNEVYKKQILLTESELKALQAQINPHFLFNVLEIINWEARMSNNETIYKMVNSLGQLLRANITLNSREKITIREELEYIEFYLYLQKMRFGDKININLSVPDISIHDFYLPKLCIQPIVENAIVHGLENKIGKGNLSINVIRLQHLICFEIIDDGVGFDTDTIDINCTETNEYSKTNRTHIGLLNANKRIKLIYGDEYGISIESKINEGTKVFVHIPFDRGAC